MNMSNLVNKNILLVALSAAILTVTGCAAKGTDSRVAVAPIGLSGASGVGYNGSGYNGGALVNNNANVTETANGLQSIVYFAFDSSEISEDSANVLNQHVSLLGENAGARVLIVGHTDPRGSREYNMALGERRAAAVRDYLAAQGIDTANVEIASRGEEELTGDYDTDRRAVLSY